MTQQLLAQEAAFGPCYAERLFAFFRRLAGFRLNKTQLCLLSGVKFFASDRPLLIERDKIAQIQARYLGLLRESLELDESTLEYVETTRRGRLRSELKYAGLLTSLIALRGLDALSKSRHCHRNPFHNVLDLFVSISAAERMLKIVVGNEVASLAASANVDDRPIECLSLIHI